MTEWCAEQHIASHFFVLYKLSSVTEQWVKMVQYYNIDKLIEQYDIMLL
jgi:hypothetical protein